MTYKYQLQDSSRNLQVEQLQALPKSLIKVILYNNNRSFLVQLFEGLESENLLTDLAFVTKTQI
jgi:hypothetical protein